MFAAPPAGAACPSAGAIALLSARNKQRAKMLTVGNAGRAR